ncbi:phosphate ABC transporter permease PstA [Pseudobutyrivibrio sp.]|uniref:phosphate ABC transporter permease PstA n=1 Tax=Pseudobutyrivibrio sp. TaxID=2014367 RepID=UPI0025D41107|nr:phosphate ABC transporter permease PstA [Pseudobutyrivibrio sp.]
MTISMRKVKDSVIRTLIYICAAFSVLLLIGIIVYVLVKGVSAVNWSFLTSVTSVLKGTVGIAGNIVNTILIIFITMVIATPIGIGSAIYLNEYAKPGMVVTVIEYATETLSGIPSIIFGLFGMMFFGEKMGLGYSLMTGALTLIIMVLPLITRNTQEALKTVPNTYRNGAIGLGSGKWHMIRTILIPSAMPGIITGTILAVGRIVGESAALLFTAGSAKQLSNGIEGLLDKPFQSGGTLTIQMYLSATSEGDFETAFGIAVVLLIIVLGINLGTKALTKHFDVTRKE